MAEIASLALEIRSDQVAQATADLRQLPKAAEAAERAAQKLGATTEAAGRTAEEFSRRVRRNIDALEFERAQLARSAAEQERYTALRRAGIAATSAEGQAITASIQALQAQRAAQQQVIEIQRKAAEAARQAQQQGDAGRKVVDALEFERAQLTRNATERAQYEALRRAGVSAASAEGKSIMTTVAALESERAALRQLELARLEADKAATKSNGMTAQQRLMLGYQLNDIFTSAVGGMNPAMIAAQQGPQITQIFGGIRGTLAAIPKALLAGGAAVLGTVAIVAAVSALKDLNEAVEAQKRRLGDMLGDQRLAAQAYADIARQARVAGEAIEDTAARYAGFARAGVFVGATGGQISALTTTVGQIARLGGVTQEEQKAGSAALAKVLKESVVSASALDDILENMPGLGRRIADGLGLSVAQMRLLANAGDLTNRQVFDALLSQQDRVAAKFKDTGITVGGFFNGILQTAKDLAVSIYNIGSSIELVNSKAEAARRAQAANSNRPTPATPRVIGNSGSALSFEEMISSGEAGQADASILNDPSRLTLQILDLQRAAKAAADESVLAGAKIADKFSSDLRETQQQADVLTKSIASLQGGLSGLDATKAAQETKRQADALQFLRDKALEAKTAYEQALQGVQTRQLQNELGLTSGQRATQSRVNQLVASQPGVSVEAAQSVVSAEQLQMLDDMIEKQTRELAVQSAITQAMRHGKAAADDAAVAMQVLGISMEQLGQITPEVQVKLDVLAETLSAIRAEARTQSGIDASKPLITELDGLAAAMKLVEQGAYAMKRAQAEVRAARDENGTGGLQMQVFDAQQALADATTLSNLKQEIALTNALAAAAGNVAEQKRIQLDYDIRLAQQQAAPGSAAALDKGMRDKAAAESSRAYADIIAQSKEYVASQEIEQQALFLSAEAASRLRLEYELLNKLKQAGVELTPAVVAGAQQSAAGMAAAEARTSQLRQAVDFAKSTTVGFLTDTRNNLLQGQSAWDAFGNAGLSALSKIADKLIEMATSQLFEAALGGLGGGKGGSWLTGDSGGGGGGGIGGFLSTALSFISGLFANGAAFQSGNVVPFARGGIVSRPTMFPMARGAGLMGEAGPEAVMPLQRGPNGRLGVANFGGAQQQAGRVDIYIYDATEMLNLKIDNRADARIVRASPVIVKKATDQSRDEVMPTVNRYKAEREGDWRAS